MPSQEELNQIFLVGDARARVASALMAHAGVRPEVLGNYEGNDGLCLQDLPDLEIKGKEVSFKEMPAMVKVRSALSKVSHEYFTFLGEEACGYLKAYLEARLREGEQLAADSAVIIPKSVRRSWTLNPSTCYEMDSHGRYWMASTGLLIRVSRVRSPHGLDLDSRPHRSMGTREVLILCGPGRTQDFFELAQLLLC